MRAFGRVYVAWAYSHDFFRDGLYRQLGFATLEDFMRDWEEDHLKWDANDLLAKIWTWQHGDISDNPIYRGDFAHALRSIEAQAIVIPCSTDMSFCRRTTKRKSRPCAAPSSACSSRHGPLRRLAWPGA